MKTNKQINICARLRNKFDSLIKKINKNTDSSWP